MKEVQLVKLKKIRTSKGITQEQLAKETNISKRQIIRYEQEQSGASLEYASRIADYLEIEIDELSDAKKKPEVKDEKISEEDSIIIYSYARHNSKKIKNNNKDVYEQLLTKYKEKKQYTVQEGKELITLLGIEYDEFIENENIKKTTKKSKIFKILYFEYWLRFYSLKRMPIVMRCVVIGALLIGVMVYSAAYALAPRGGLVQSGLEIVWCSLFFGLATFTARIVTITLSESQQDDSALLIEPFIWYSTYVFAFLFLVILFLGLLCLCVGFCLR